MGVYGDTWQEGKLVVKAIKPGSVSRQAFSDIWASTKMVSVGDLWFTIENFPKSDSCMRPQVSTASARPIYWLVFLGLIISGLTFFPGWMSNDSLIQYREARAGSFNDWHPVLMAWWWRQLDHVYQGPALFLFQNLLLYWGAWGLLANALRRDVGKYAYLLPILGLWPGVFFVLGQVWKDVAFACCQFMAWAIVINAYCWQRKTSNVERAALIALLIFSVGVKTNGIIVVPFLVAFWLRNDQIRFGLCFMALATAVTAAAFVIPNGITRALPVKHDNPMQYTQVYDLLAISAKSGQNRLPAYINKKVQLPDDKLSQLYTVGNNNALFYGFTNDLIGLRAPTPSDASELQQAWLTAIKEYPAHYLAHRWDNFLSLLRIGRHTDAYVASALVVPNEFGISVKGNKFSNWLDKQPRFHPWFFYPWTYFLLTLASIFVLYKRKERRLLALLVGGSSLAFAAPHLFIAPASDFRYLYYSYFCFFIIFSFASLEWVKLLKSQAIQYGTRAIEASRKSWANRQIRKPAIDAGKNANLLAALAIFAIVISAYSSVLTNAFAVLDDWVFLNSAVTHEGGTVPLLVSAGRPLNAYLFDMGFSAAGSIEGLTMLRLVTISGISLLAFGLYLFSRAQRIEYATSILIAAGVALLPSFQVYAAWAQHFTTPYAGILALFSAFLLTPSSKICKKSRTSTILASTCVLAISLLIYQPIAMLFWTGILISLVAGLDHDSDQGARWDKAKLFDVFVAFSLAMITAFAIFKVGQYFYPNGSSRYGLVKDLSGKLAWFVSEPLLNSASLYTLPRSLFVPKLAAALFSIGVLFFWMQRGIKVAITVALVSVCALLLAYTPNLLTAENWASYRSTGALAATTLVALIMVLRRPAKYIARHMLRKARFQTLAPLPLALSFALASGMVMTTQSSVYKGFVLPNVTELNNLAGFLMEQKSVRPENPAIVVKPSSWQDSSAPVRLYDEFGMQSSLNDHYSLVMVKSVLRSMGLFPYATVSLHSEVSKANGGNFKPDDLIIDFPKLATALRFKSDLSKLSGNEQRVLYAANINDQNWTAGIWTNAAAPYEFSFTYRKLAGGTIPKVGDRLVFKNSAARAIKRIDVGEEYVNILVEGAALVPADGYPNPVYIGGTSNN